MGSDLGPGVMVGGALLAAAEGYDVALVGDKATLRAELARRGPPSPRVTIVHAPDVVEMGDKGAAGVRSHRETSMYIGAALLKGGGAQALVSMGNTGAMMATALVVLGRLRGVERPALGAVLPGGEHGVLLLDVGANADARAPQLVQFARLGSAYMRAIYGIEAPRVALLSIGEEPSKGSSLVLEAHGLLAAAKDLRFIGNIESRDLVSGHADVVVTDGFTGNIALKLAEGIVQLLFGALRDAARSSLLGRVGGALLLPSLRGLRDRLDYRQYGAAPLLGIDGVVLVGHGRSDERAVASAIRAARRAVDQGMLAALVASSGPADGTDDAPARVEG
ncbi:MAG: phosphate acyltransferase PlsX [Dehalococcoidia bacterium]|nr:phosphate acyltransferase PlsX [Dehalococcoidia bacterium]